MKTDCLIFRKLTPNEFKAINNLIKSEGGGSQTYIDFPKGKISDDDFQTFFNNSGEEIKNGYEWKFVVRNDITGESAQNVTISARRTSSNSLREQNNNRLVAWKPEITGFPSASDPYDEDNPVVLYILRSTNLQYWAGWFYRNNCDDSWFMTKNLSKMIFDDCGFVQFDYPIEFDPKNVNWTFGYKSLKSFDLGDVGTESYNLYISALHTKPFLLLAGISGTGKSQKVQELAFMSCPEELKNEEGTTPKNYCLIEVKPNWHDSSELLGYYSALTGKYELTDFIRFAYRAVKYPKCPFFLCLDEMNLAPVEQYFAEFLSVLETRKTVDGKILSKPLLKKEKFTNCELGEEVEKISEDIVTDESTGQKIKRQLYSQGEDYEIIKYLKENGLPLPSNLFVIGTVNMDDTTHQFSRKVIDRAFTIEMNGGKMAEMFSQESRNLLEYREEPVPLSVFQSEFVRAYEVFEDARFSQYEDIIVERIPEILGEPDGDVSKDSINGILHTTPFRVSYRVQNELVLYLSVLIEQAGYPDNIDSLIKEATLAILMEKILPRVQGEKKQLETANGSDVLKDMKTFVETYFAPGTGHDATMFNKVIKKLDEMEKKLDSYYTNFF